MAALELKLERLDGGWHCHGEHCLPMKVKVPSYPWGRRGWASDWQRLHVQKSFCDVDFQVQILMRSSSGEAVNQCHSLWRILGATNILCTLLACQIKWHANSYKWWHRTAWLNCKVRLVNKKEGFDINGHRILAHAFNISHCILQQNFQLQQVTDNIAICWIFFLKSTSVNLLKVKTIFYLFIYLFFAVCLQIAPAQPRLLSTLAPAQLLCQVSVPPAHSWSLLPLRRLPVLLGETHCGGNFEL